MIQFICETYKGEEIIAEWYITTKDAKLGAISFALGWMDCYSKCHKKEYIMTPMVQSIDGYTWWNYQHSKKWKLIDTETSQIVK